MLAVSIHVFHDNSNGTAVVRFEVEIKNNHIQPKSHYMLGK